MTIDREARCRARTEEAVLQLCRFVSPDRERLLQLLEEGIDSPLLLGQLLFHRMGGAAYTVLEQTGLLGRVNREVRTSLQTVYEVNRIKTDSFRTMLTLLARTLEGVEAPYACLKGAYLAEVYPQGLRTSNDIDLLTQGKQVDEFCRRLKEAGFVQGSVSGGVLRPATRREILDSRLNRGETVPFLKEVNLPFVRFMEVDINFSLDYQPRQATPVLPLLLSRVRRCIATGAGALPTLEPADFLLHLCAHLYKEASTYGWVQMGRDQSLYKFSDLYLLLSGEGAAALCRALPARAEECGLQKEAYYALYHMQELFAPDRPELARTLQELRPADTSYLNEIVSPADGRRYRFEEPFQDWLFDGRRMDKLIEERGEEKT